MNIQQAIADIVTTEDLLERVLKLSGWVTALFVEIGFELVVIGGENG